MIAMDLKAIWEMSVNESERLATVIAPPLILLSGFINFVIFHDYGLRQPEIIMAFGALAGASLLLGAALALCPWAVIRMLGLLFFLVLFLDIQFQVISHALSGNSWIESRVFGFFILFVAFAIVGLLANAVRRHLAQILTAIFGVVLIGIVISPPQPERMGVITIPPAVTAVRDLPPIVHIILDGQIEIEGLPPEIEGSREIRSDLREFFLSEGFVLFGNA